MKKVFLILAICLCTFCSKKKAENPKDLYSMEQVAVFLKDLYMLESKVKELRLTKDSTKIIFDYYEKKLYEEHNMTESLYRESFKYYMDDVKGLSKIYEIIADSLSLEERLANVKDREPYEEE
ncbi:MAG: DUF4296 domain-containing protein [Cyclobacteriaceae bacterium]|nr:DUF4296 domain-containing protein [Cyclobacteriaceae bacterium]MCK5278082.1 DUF4296 domain-containing protein [Cyclobacteriaceae bacterium]MCK5371189.1 DUF4296 domain-containing protein [Cyclobacteriaceae bacterium]MCK5471556.1 DUF4296 domain-containing protein [Cyclobacteriaceae bacterium]